MNAQEANIVQAELVTKAKEYLSGAPKDATCAQGLAGFSGLIGFLCARCAGRISARGFGLLNAVEARNPVWSDQAHANCSVCGKQ